MLYLDYSRKDGEWLPNPHGGNENLEAVAFLRRLNEAVYARHPGAITIAEESTAWPAVSQPTFAGGLGFGFKWNMGWMHDTLEYLAEDPVHRRWHHDKMTFGLMYAFAENFVLPLSHDEVVHGKRSLLGRIHGDAWQQFATLRAYYAVMWAHPGKKLLFMGQEFAQGREWNFDAGLDWPSLVDRLAPRRAGARARLQPRLRAELPALHERDCEAEGFRWIVVDDADHSVFAWLRFAGDGARPIVVDRELHAGAASALPHRPAAIRAAGAKSSIRTAPPTVGRTAATRAVSTRSPANATAFPSRPRSCCRRSEPFGSCTRAAHDLAFGPPARRRTRKERHGQGNLLDAARALGDGVRARRRPRQPADGAHRKAGEARGLFRRQVADHRFRAVERAQFRHPAHRGRHAIQGAQPHPAHAARLELLPAGAQRELRHPAREPARRRGPVVRGHGRRRLPEHRHHRRLRARVHHHPGRRSRLQDGLRADAGRARQRRRGRDGGVPRGAGRRGDGIRRHARRRHRTHRVVRRKAAGASGDARPPRLGAREHGHLRVQPRIPARPAAARRRGPDVEPRLRPRHHSLDRRRTATRSRTASRSRA